MKQQLQLYKAINLNVKTIFRQFSSSSISSKSSEMKWLNVAEKNDAAKTISGLLSKGRSVRVSI